MVYQQLLWSHLIAVSSYVPHNPIGAFVCVCVHGTFQKRREPEVIYTKEEHSEGKPSISDHLRALGYTGGV